MKLKLPNPSLEDRILSHQQLDKLEEEEGWRQTKMGKQGPVYVDLRGVLCGTRKCVAIPLFMLESWRRRVMLSCFRYFK